MSDILTICFYSELLTTKIDIAILEPVDVNTGNELESTDSCTPRLIINEQINGGINDQNLETLGECLTGLIYTFR